MNTWIDLAQVMLTKLCTDMLNNQINFYMVITTSAYFFEGRPESLNAIDNKVCAAATQKSSS
jgi:hypothetical protein